MMALLLLAAPPERPVWYVALVGGAMLLGLLALAASLDAKAQREAEDGPPREHAPDVYDHAGDD